MSHTTQHNHGAEDPGVGGGFPLVSCQKWPKLCPPETGPVQEPLPFAAIWDRYRTLDIEPSTAEWREFANLSRQAGLLEEACYMTELAESGTNDVSEIASCLQLRATILTELNKLSEAVQILQRIQELQPLDDA